MLVNWPHPLQLQYLDSLFGDLMYARLRNFLDLARKWQNHGERPHTARLRECLNGGL